MKLTEKKWLAVLAAVLTTCLTCNIASAGMINMLVSNVDVQFDGSLSGGKLFDKSNALGGNLNTAQSRPVTSTEFEVNGISTPPLLMNPPDPIYFDMSITNLGSTLTTGSLVSDVGNNGGQVFGLDWFDTGTGSQVRLGIDKISYTLIETGVPGLNFFSFFGTAKVLSQNLPIGMSFEQEVGFIYSASEVMLVKNGNGGVKDLVASGQLTITGGMVVPEPASGLMLLSLFAGSAVVMRYRLG